MPTPPVAPVTAIIVQPRPEPPAAADALPRHALQRGRQVFGLERLREELLRPGPHRPQDQVAVGRGAGDQDRAVGRRLRQRRDQLERLIRIAVERDEADVRDSSARRRRRRTRSASTRLRATPLSSPSSIDFSASRDAVLRIDNGDSQDVGHAEEFRGQRSEVRCEVAGSKAAAVGRIAGCTALTSDL